MKVLVVFEWVPENTKFHIIENPTDQEMKYLELANGKIINSSEFTPEEQEAMDYVNNALSNNPKHCFGGDPANHCKWKDTEVQTPILTPIDRVYTMGFML